MKLSLASLEKEKDKQAEDSRCLSTEQKEGMGSRMRSGRVSLRTFVDFTLPIHSITTGRIFQCLFTELDIY